MMFRALRPHRRNRLPSLAAGAAALLVQSALALIVQWLPAPVPEFDAPIGRAPTHSSSLTFIPLPHAGEATRADAALTRDPQRIASNLSPSATHTQSAPDSARVESVRPYALFDNPLTPARDVRLITPYTSAIDSLRSLHYHLARVSLDAVARARVANGALDWTLGNEDVRFGLSPGRLHLGRLSIPVPVAVRSLRDADPRIREQHAMLRELRDQADRRERVGSSRQAAPH